MIERLFANVNVISPGIEQIGKIRYNTKYITADDQFTENPEMTHEGRKK